jgi:hypothetical protein
MYVCMYLCIMYVFIYGPALEVAAPTVFTVWLRACEDLVTFPRTASHKSSTRSGITRSIFTLSSLLDSGLQSDIFYFTSFVPKFSMHLALPSSMQHTLAWNHSISTYRVWQTIESLMQPTLWQTIERLMQPTLRQTIKLSMQPCSQH